MGQILLSLQIAVIVFSVHIESVLVTLSAKWKTTFKFAGYIKTDMIKLQKVKVKEIWLVSFIFLLCFENILKRKRDYQNLGEPLG